MSDNLPKFDDPPVIETVLSAQFSQIEKLSSAHAGLYWKSLDENWTSINETGPILEQFEKFGKERIMTGMSPTVQFSIPGQETSRHQITTESGERMIQVQDTRFTYNWLKKDDDYPSYDELLPEFREKFDRFIKFVSDSGLGGIELNQWEVTYVNELYKGDLWEDLSDIKKVFPGFYIPTSSSCDLTFDAFSGRWGKEIGNEQGRIHISLSFGRKNSKASPRDGQELFLLQLVARGPIESENGIDLYKGFNIGHETIVKSFHDITGEYAHNFWKLRP